MRSVSLSRRVLSAAALGILALACVLPEVAQAGDEYPNRPIKLVVPYPPGGGNDVLARMIAPKLAEELKGQVVVDNRGGAGGTIGTAYVATQPADGYTILIVNTLPHTSVAGMYANLPYDPLKSFAAIGQFAAVPYMLVVNPKVNAPTVKDFLALAKAKPDSINYASAGNGSATHLAAEYFKSVTKAEITHVPYKGGGPALTDLIANQVQATFENVAVLVPFVNQGTLRPLVITGPKRSPLFPSVPTMADLGYAGFDVSGKFGLVAPAGTPAGIIQTLNAALVRAASNPDLARQLQAQGADVTTGSAAEFDKLLNQESGTWLRLLKGANIKND